MKLKFFLLSICTLLIFSCQQQEEIDEAIKWHKVTLNFNGPQTKEGDETNPFTDYRLMVTFTNGQSEYVIPGFYAADGNAAESGAVQGNIWQVRFVPDQTGEWRYVASFRQGPNIAVSDNLEDGEPVAFDGQSGKIMVTDVPENAVGFHRKGRLKYANQRYLQFEETGEYFLKGGADSPENFLAYQDFDSTYRYVEESRQGEAATGKATHTYQRHINDWKDGDPTWQGGKGKGMIGALNYLAEQGMNSVYFLTMNIGGDGKDVWPYTHHEERLRFDVSKLDQWEIVFDHMDNLGLMLHIVTQETENELLLDNGNTGLERKLYYRELIARFGHHLAITWNMGEENGPASFSPEAQNTQQQKDMVQYIKTHNPYNAFVVIHTHHNPKDRYELFEPLLGFQYLDGPSIQSSTEVLHDETKTWLERSAAAGKQWVVCSDEIGPASQGVDPDDKADNNQDTVRHEVLWGNLMAGGGGAEWYFGYKNPHNDLNMEDWRSRAQMWKYTNIALDFFQQHLPFWEMNSSDDLTTAPDDYCLVKPGQSYAVYLPPSVPSTSLNLSETEGTFSVQWYNPRSGGDLQKGEVSEVNGGEVVDLGQAPEQDEQDWVVLVTKI